LFIFQLSEHEIGEEERVNQRHLASEAHDRRLKYVEQEAREAQEHGRDLTQDAIDTAYSMYKYSR